MPPDDLANDDAVGQFSVGTVAARLGVSAATVRSWGTRYGLVPAIRSAGGHRRYSESDVSSLTHMQALVSHGVRPAVAARVVLAGGRPDDGSDRPGHQGGADDQLGSRSDGREEIPRRPGGPGGRVLAVPNGTAAARGLARAASRLDAAAIAQIVGRLLDETGARATWDDVLRPVLAAAGAAWARTGTGIDIEHVLSEAIIEALRLYRVRQWAAGPLPPVLLAGSASELHVLPLHVVAAALAERGVPTLLLGARVPGAALASAARRTRASAVFLWRQSVSDEAAESDDLTPMRPSVQVVVGGPGWEDVELPPSVHRAPDLDSAVNALEAAAQA
ncbi:hypothetical protein ABIB25_004962 [Nakamurella sp. UYEF19]|uniref:MerR family transcriptional regulator n=1 Tax=Nakamurella sp. UYEF19 TaxID=1756392 RepID=UPI00339356B6